MFVGVSNAVKARKTQELRIRRKSQLNEMKWNEAQKRFHPLMKAKESELPRIQNQSLLFMEHDFDQMNFKDSALLERLVHMLKVSKRARVLEKPPSIYPPKGDARISMENMKFLNSQSDSKKHFWGGNPVVTHHLIAINAVDLRTCYCH